MDFHAPRLDKLVTEVTPANVTSASQTEILDPSHFMAFYRLGSGSQYIQNADGNQTKISGAYSYLTGGTLPTSFYSHGGASGIQVYLGGNLSNYGATLFKGEDNLRLLKKTRAMIAAREFILSDSADRWTQVVDNRMQTAVHGL